MRERAVALFISLILLAGNEDEDEVGDSERDVVDVGGGDDGIKS